ncbi:hypothetical protein SKAU_G00330610 [Synaphobranchus kaupii]|uniref:Uncharacterized protein n=1 Tax=Synaphobranchus kaupii TaxID=118154 RepID=A0A9Q1IHI3_SYNKA|nr:hypothetical protein SKAU_G00330610 [Synaphobranchus kaupii]
MSPDEYKLLWIAMDLASLAVVIGIFVFKTAPCEPPSQTGPAPTDAFMWRLSGMQRYNPEQIMLSAAVRRSSPDVNMMKEKLIFSEVSNGMGGGDELSVSGLLHKPRHRPLTRATYTEAHRT